ncbi:MAG TPA: FAD:protein FMN transferase [Longimicrobiales bacterium]|nr:FAD:protein FMN transferase [Longimicrobiales bacterium]
MNEHVSGRGPSRREFLVLGAGVFAVSAVGAGFRRQRLVRRTVPVMGTIAEVAVVSRDEVAAHQAITAAVDELHAVERAMTRFNARSDIGRANLHAHAGPVAVTAATAAVVAESLRWAAADGGRFDPCIGRASELWDVAHRTEPPVPGDVRRLAGRGLYRGLELGTRGGSSVLVYNDPDIGLDLGGIAKGYGVDRAVAALRDWGITNALVNAGGDLYAMGTNAEGDPWRVGIRSPADPTRLAGTFPLSDRAVATSGDYEQYFDHAGRRYHHLLDPETAAPRTGSGHSITVAAESCMTADAAATAVFGLDDVPARRVLARTAPLAEIIRVA